MRSAALSPLYRRYGGKAAVKRTTTNRRGLQAGILGLYGANDILEITKVDELMALCDRLKANPTAPTPHRTRLLDALLAEALAPAAEALQAAEGGYERPQPFPE